MQIGKGGRAVSAICDARADRIEIRGRDLTSQLMGRIGFVDHRNHGRSFEHVRSSGSFRCGRFLAFNFVNRYRVFGKLSCLGAVLLEFVWGKASSLAGDIVFHEHRSPYGPFSFVCFDEASSYDNDSANRRVVLVSGSTSGSDSKAEKKQALGLEKMD